MPQQIKFDKYPEKTVQGYKAVQGWEDVRECLDKAAKENGVLTAEFYPGVYREELVNELAKLGFACLLYTSGRVAQHAAFSCWASHLRLAQ